MRWLIALALAVLAAGAFFLLSRSTGPGVGPGAGDGVERVSDLNPVSADASPDLAEPQSNQRGDRVVTAIDAQAATHAVAPPPVEEAVDPARAVRVRVVDETGTPVPGIDVKIVCYITGASGENQWASETSRAPDGLALFEFAKFSKRLDRLRVMKIEPVIVARADVPSARPIAVEFENGIAEGAEVDLVLAATGSVVVRVLDSTGEPYLGETDVYFWWVPAEERLRDPASPMRRVGSHRRSATDGIVRFDGVGLDVALSFTAWSGGLEGGSLKDVAGPDHSADVRVVEIRLGGERPVVCFRVVDTRGQAVADTKIEAAFVELPVANEHGQLISPRPRTEWATTDSTGHARIFCSTRSWSVDRELDVVCRGRKDRPNDDPDGRVGTAPLPRVFKPGAEIDLGDIRLGPTPVLAEGVVVDESGVPLSDVDLRFREGGSANLRDTRIRSDANGHFLLRGPRAPLKLGVWASLSGFDLVQLGEIPIGSSNVVIEMKRTAPVEPKPMGQLAIELKMAPGTPFLRLGLYWNSEAGSHSTECPPPGIGPFELKALPPGNYSVWIKSRDGHVKFGRVDDVVVIADQTTSDARLLPLDLTQVIRTVELQLVHPSGTPFHKARPQIILDEVQSEFGVRCDRSGRVAFVVPHEVTRIAVWVEDGERVEVPLPREPGPIKVEIR